MLAEVKVLYPHNFRDVVASLRHIADMVERGDYGNVPCACLVLKTLGDVQIFGFGKSETSAMSASLLAVAANRLLETIAQQGDG